MTIQSDGMQAPSLVVARCQEEIRTLLDRLRELEETTGMASWSSSIRQQHLLVLDDLAALEAYLEIFKCSLLEKTQADGKTLTGELTES